MKPLSIIKKENADLEKPANRLTLPNMKNSYLLWTAILLLGVFQALNAQNTERIPFDQGKKYILGKVNVTGKISYNELTVVTFAGLEKGQEITVPGEQISNAIKKLGKLGLFSDIDFYASEIRGDTIDLELNITELPKLNDVRINGVKKNKIEDLIKENALTKGKIVNENLITTTRNYLENKYKKEGYFNAKVSVKTSPVDSTVNQVNMIVGIDKGDKIKINRITFEGNEKFSDKKLRKAMKGTKQQNPIRIFKASKFIRSKFNEDLVSIVEKYKEKGYRDARIVSDSVWLDTKKQKLALNIKVEEGRKYYFGNIKFLGNSVYSDQALSGMLGIKKGDTYNGVLLEKRISDKSKPDGDDITNLYQNNGYLFSTINAVEVKTEKDSIDFEIRVVEGPIAYFNKITVVGNDKTNDKVIYRELRTKPGEKYSKEDLVRTVREIGQLGFFDPEAIDPKFKNVDPTAGTVDIEYNLVERGSSQIELQGGYGGGGFIGTLGLSFNNFSIANIFKKSAYKPLPMGDGQKLALRLQASTFFRTYSFSFSEPWFGGKKPVSFSASVSQSKQYLFSGSFNSIDRSRSFDITSVTIGLAKRLTIPDDFFILSGNLSFQYYNLNNYNTGLFTFGNGTSRNFGFSVGLTRNNKAINPIYPIRGAEFSINAKFSPPYSLWNGVDYGDLPNQAEFKKRFDPNTMTADPNVNVLPAVGDFVTQNPNTGLYTRVDTFQEADVDQAKVDQKRFNWLEYYKIKFKADAYTKLQGNLVLRSLTEFGFLGAYNQERGVVPFERFFVGGDGLANFALDGREIIQLRGYPNQSLSSNVGGSIYNKFTLELRYPITLKAAASIYALTFLEGGASFNNFRSFNPFAIQRSAGFGIRVFMPAFGLLGIDFAQGFDFIPGTTQKGGWQTHFIIGQQF
jgi:outer membrane protein insertion porin family